jgi:hypothetical protein
MMFESDLGADALALVRPGPRDQRHRPDTTLAEARRIEFRHIQLASRDSFLPSPKEGEEVNHHLYT